MTKLLVVLSLAAGASAEWRGVADALAAKHAAEAAVAVECADPTNCMETLRRERPRYVAFVMQPCELDEGVAARLRETMRTVDGDPYDDAIWSVLTAPTPADALRIASSREPSRPVSILATTGVSPDAVPGPVTVISDAYPEGEWWSKAADGAISRHSTTGETARVFADAWNAFDPDLLLTSAHATEHNLEMPFSRGMIVPEKTSARGFLTAGASGHSILDPANPVRLAPARREKVWLAAGNCLIANHVDDRDMVMTALSFGKVNQFVGYTKPTWFGFVGWNTWRFFSGGQPLNESYYAANQWLNHKLSAGEAKDDLEQKGLLWDRDATLFYGDPMFRVTLPAADKAGCADRLPRLVVFPSSLTTPPEITPPEGATAVVADDFALFLPSEPM